jgi:hypothetical protein
MNGRFVVGNKEGKGRPPGRLNRATIFQEALEKGGVEIIRKVKSQALKADPTAMRLCMERLVPLAKPRNSRFPAPVAKTAEDLMQSISELLKVVAEGVLSAQEGESVARIIESQRRMIETEGYDARLRVLEEPRSSSEEEICAED